MKEMSQLDQIDKESQSNKVLIFKHSTRCSISDAALSRIEREWRDEFNARVRPYYLDLIAHRDVSNAIANRYGVEHQSPQVLMIVKGKCIYSQSHSGIRVSEIMEYA